MTWATSPRALEESDDRCAPASPNATSAEQLARQVKRENPEMGAHLCQHHGSKAAAIHRVIHHSVILEFDLSSYRTDASYQRGQAEEVNLQN